MNETKRDLQADLELCERATPGPWKFSGGKFGELVVYSPKFRRFANNGGEIAELEFWMEDEARFIAEARTGWPHAIRRAIEAEKRVAELEAENERLREQLRDLNEYKRLAEWGLRKVFGEERTARHGV